MAGDPGGSNFRCIKFNTPDEKINFMNFVKNNFSFCNRLQLNNMLSGRDDSSCFIKVDWTKSDWTVEKIFFLGTWVSVFSVKSTPLLLVHRFLPGLERLTRRNSDFIYLLF